MTDVEIIKIPLSAENIPTAVSKFKRMPILYLELIENKAKVKPDLVNKPYEPRKSDASSRSKVEESRVVDSDKNVKDIDDNQLEDGEEPVDDPPERDKFDNIKIPTLSELQAKNPEETLIKKDYRFPRTDDEETVKKRNEVFFHYEVLKRMHPNAPIPEFTIYSDPDVMGQKYELLTKKLALDSSVESWKRYMIIFVMGLEVVLGKLSFDIEGFAQQQLMQMHTYDSLLVEMAEKSYTPNGSSKWPVEIRLLMILTVNTALFMICKMIQKKTGTNLLGTINHLTNPSGEKLMRAPPSAETGSNSK
jgi:hypothetical protein